MRTVKYYATLGPTVVAENTNCQEIYDEAIEGCEKFKILFSMSGKCHRVFNSAHPLQLDEIHTLEEDIKCFMEYLRLNWPKMRISPKPHMVEDHIIPFLMRWRVDCGFYGEQDGESIHKTINTMKRNCSNIKTDIDHLKYIMNCHLASAHPTARVTRSCCEKAKKFETHDESTLKCQSLTKVRSRLENLTCIYILTFWHIFVNSFLEITLG